jgi:hypothetical protein
LAEECRLHGSCSGKGEQGGTEVIKRKRDNESREEGKERIA